MATWVRDSAMMSMTSPLGDDALIPTKLVAEEAISQPFRFDITAVSQNGVFDPNSLLNMPVCVKLQDTSGTSPTTVRYFHGIVQQVRPDGILRGATLVDEFQLYALTVMPRLWFLGQTLDCRVYQDKSAKDILSAMFTDASLTDITFNVSGPATRPYTVQFNESDYAFAHRLMEQEGWFYFFEHTADKHTLVIADQSSAFQTIPNATLHFAVNQTDLGGIMDWKPPVRTVTGAFAMGDYDPENPGTKLYNQQNTLLKAGGASARDVYHWPALTPTSSVVEGRAKFAQEAAEAATSLYNGSSHYGALVPGGKFTLTNTPAGPDDGSFTVRSVHHEIEDSSWISSDGSVTYQNRFEAFKATLTWREPFATPHPRMEGVHSALVMGPQSSAASDIKMQSGEEIYTDDLARVKVRFYWDWRAEATGSGSVWARVIQPWAGNGWGTQFIPRVGTEVAVAFVDGNPDRPIVIGGLYNGVSAPIYAVADKTKSGIRTRSSLSGDTSSFNELTFDDKAGSELIFTHAQKDLTTEVEHDESLTVDNCRVVLVKSDETITVKGKQTITVTKDHTFEVTQGNFTSTIDQGNHDLKVSLGNITVKASAGSISMEAMQSITLKVGQNTLTIDQTGVTIKGMMTSVQAQTQAELKGLMTSVSGSAMLTLKGGITMIN
ncbi:MAG TPA: type VI secretion system tip protein TssI/VgrG [Acetobacteraceae bacterium]|nr:type VI secretion system tip protein TssI/VgrG [Acetobacteraceae bacterium]